MTTEPDRGITCECDRCGKPFRLHAEEDEEDVKGESAAIRLSGEEGSPVLAVTCPHCGHVHEMI